ncbi:MAG: dihydropteroate synthase [Gammaproteobacteria bacterium]|nr:MAG: dihydropteroate synthase [Gammaproteobacteria bacterium]RTZ62285.1 MAG: dihydropteroate synthase [Gammaproteobacteria bacterium]
MGVLNVTPDSFSDGGLFVTPDQALAQAGKMKRDGADIIDIGGESTRPGAEPVSVQEELDRILPAIERITRNVDIPVSIDSWKPQVMQAAVEAGASLINDVNALQASGAMEVAAQSGVAVCLMHKQGNPQTMQDNPSYDDVTAEVKAFLYGRIQTCISAGIDLGRIIIDPGFGFGKKLKHNYILLKNMAKLTDLGVPVLAGLSRKSMIGKELGLPVGQRLSASLSLALIAVANGAQFLRVHDVKETVEAVRMYEAVMNVEQGKP